MTNKELKKVQKIFQQLLPKGVKLTVKKYCVGIKAPKGCKKELADSVMNYISGVKYYFAWAKDKRFR